MEILINDGKSIKEVQKEFSSEFPFLKIEFFDIPLNERKILPKSHIYPPNKTIGSCRKLHYEGALRISGSTTVGDLEKFLWDKFGLSVQIFRKSGNLWIETSLTDAWTLQRQNKEGKEFSHWYGGTANGGEDMADRDKWV